MKLLPIKLPEKATRAIGKLAFKTAKAKPGICIVIGIILGGAAVIMTGIDTYKNKEKLADDSNNIKLLKAPQDTESEDAVLISEEERKGQLMSARKQFMVDFIRIYWKEAALSAGAVFFILHGKKLYKHQIAELGAIYTALLQSYKQYRQNVIADMGVEKDQEYMYGLKKTETVDSETGEVREVYLSDGKTHAPSIYSRWLTEGVFDNNTGMWIWQNTLWDENKIQMENNIRWVQNNANDILTRRGYLFLNDVYDMLRLPRTKEGYHVGWVKDGLINDIPCDNYIDFGVFPPEEGRPDHQLPVNKKWLDLRDNQRYPLLDFNVTCIDSVLDDIYEYDNRSFLAFEKRRAKNQSFESSKAMMEHFWANNDILESEGH